MRKSSTGMLSRWVGSSIRRSQFCSSPWPAVDKPVMPREGREGEGRHG